MNILTEKFKFERLKKYNDSLIQHIMSREWLLKGNDSTVLDSAYPEISLEAIA